MAKKTFYEWDAEEWDENDDIIDHHHADNFKMLHEWYKTEPGIHFVLVKEVWCTIEEDLKHRTHAYIDNGNIPSQFEDGSKVPQKFINEFNRVWG